MEKTLRQRFGAQVGKFNNYYDSLGGPRYTLMFDRSVENRVNLHITPEGPSVASMLHSDDGWLTNDGGRFKTLADGAEHLIKIRAEPRTGIVGDDATVIQGHPSPTGRLGLSQPEMQELPKSREYRIAHNIEGASELSKLGVPFGLDIGNGKIVHVDFDAVEKRAIMHLEPEDREPFLDRFGPGVKMEQISGPLMEMPITATDKRFPGAAVGARFGKLRRSVDRIRTAFSSAAAERLSRVPAVRRVRTARVVRKLTPSTYSPKKRSITGLYKGSKMAKRATKRGGNHAKSKFAGEPEFVYE